MRFEDVLMQLLMSLGAMFPMLVVWAIGAILAIAFWKRNPKSAQLVLLACLIGIFTDLGFSVAYIVIPQYWHDMTKAGPMGIRTVFTVVGFVRSGCMALAWALMLGAVFRRSPAA